MLPPLRLWCLLELTGDSLAGYLRQVFVDEGPAAAKTGSAVALLESHYPKSDRDFKIIRVDVATSEAEAVAMTRAGRITE